MNTPTVAPSTQSYNLIDLQAAHPFWLRVREMPSGCWEWQGAIHNGILTYCTRGKHVHARKFAHEQTIGPVQEKRRWVATCGNAKCVHPLHILTPNHVERFWAKVNKDGPIPAHMPHLGPCWVWTGRTNRAGYGGFDITSKVRTSAHRFSYELATGEKLGEDCALHHCDNPACVRPDHLFRGDLIANAKDRDAKGRTASGDRSGARMHPERVARGDRSGARMHPESWIGRRATGDRNGSRTRPETLMRGEMVNTAKLTADQVVEIRRLFSAGMPKLRLSKMFGVSRYMILLIVERRNWKHVA